MKKKIDLRFGKYNPKNLHRIITGMGLIRILFGGNFRMNEKEKKRFLIRENDKSIRNSFICRQNEMNRYMFAEHNL